MELPFLSETASYIFIGGFVLCGMVVTLSVMAMSRGGNRQALGVRMMIIAVLEFFFLLSLYAGLAFFKV